MKSAKIRFNFCVTQKLNSGFRLGILMNQKLKLNIFIFQLQVLKQYLASAHLCIFEDTLVALMYEETTFLFVLNSTFPLVSFYNTCFSSFDPAYDIAFSTTVVLHLIVHLGRCHARLISLFILSSQVWNCESKSSSKAFFLNRGP